jgi:aldehyde:ferredoxin oxidoreductase
LRELGILPGSELRELELTWGNSQTSMELVRQIARCEGFGAVLAEGSRALGARYGVEGMAVQINGLEVAMHDPRAASGMAVSYATSPVGASHNHSDFFLVETGRAMEDLGLPMGDRFESVGKAQYVAMHQDWRTFNNSLVLCFFPNPPVQDFCAMVSAATGYDVTLENVLQWGERMWNIKRAFNLKMGYRARQSETLPELMLRPLAEGGTEGHVPDFDLMMREYYTHRDWDWETGKPSRAKLLALGMNDVAKDLWDTPT